MASAKNPAQSAPPQSAAAIMVATSSLKPWSRNPRHNDGRPVDEVARSIQRFGFASPIIALKDGRVLAGHTRLKAANKLGILEVPVRYVDLSDKEAEAFLLADNRTGELASWDDESLRAILLDIRKEGRIDGLGWDEEELSAILAGDVDVTDADDDAPPAPSDANAVSETGKVYELGPHRLVCGDSTDPTTWAALLGGEELDMVWTDPPYGVAYVGKTKDAMIVENDDLDEAELSALLRDSLSLAFEHSKPGACWYVAAPPGPLFHVFGGVLKELRVWRQTLNWIKDVFVMGRSEYHYQHEPIFFGWKDGARHYTDGARNRSTLMEFPRPKRSIEHPTMKPVALVADGLRRSSKPGWIVGEPFGGSGTTLIAAARTGRVARLIELAPRYCDVIRKRWGDWARLNGVEPGPGAL